MAAAPMPPSQAPVLATAPRMIGDLPGYFSAAQLSVAYLLTDPVTQRLNQDPNANFAQVVERYNFATLALSRGSFKIAENESPQPQDRFFVTYNYFHDVPARPLGSTGELTLLPQSPNFRAFGPGPFPLATTLTGTLNGTGAPGSLTTASASGGYDVHRQTVGFEKTLFDGRASAGLRVPVFQSDPAFATAFDPQRLAAFQSQTTTGRNLTADADLDNSRIGDLSAVFKYAIINEPACGSALSTGLVVTVPTGGGIPLADGSRLTSALLQPFVGALRTWDRLFVHGFSAVAVGTDARDVTLWFNDIGLGYFVYRADDGFITAIAPTAEAHLTTGLGDDRSAGVFANDILVLTGGVNVGLGGRATLTAGVATPVTGPRPNRVEAVVQFNWGF